MKPPKTLIPAILAALTASFSPAAAAPPEFFAMDTGTRDADHKTPAQQAALVRELGFAGLGPTYRNPEHLRETLAALDERQLRLFAIYAPLDLDAPAPVSPAIRDMIAQLQGRDAVIWLYLKSATHQPSDPAGDAAAVPILREIADLAADAGVRISLYPHFQNWIERVDDGVRVARKVNRRNLGVTFNLCHWLRVDGTALDARLREALPYLDIVTLNGADEGSREWNSLIQPLGHGTFDVANLLATLARLHWRGPVGLQHYGIPGDAKTNLQTSITAWQELSAKTWPDTPTPNTP